MLQNILSSTILAPGCQSSQSFFHSGVKNGAVICALWLLELCHVALWEFFFQQIPKIVCNIWKNFVFTYLFFVIHCLNVLLPIRDKQIKMSVWTVQTVQTVQTDSTDLLLQKAYLSAQSPVS